MIFLGLKGFGDLSILLGFLMRINTRQTLIVRSELYELAFKYVGKKHNVISLKTLEKILPIYGLRKFKISSLFKTIITFIEIRKLIAKLKEPVILDDKSIRNFLFFYYAKVIYLPNSKTIYEAYEVFFRLPKIKPCQDGIGNKCIVFPFGSMPNKCITERDVIKIIDSNSLNYEEVLICVHKSHRENLNKFKRFETIYYESICELVDLINAHQIVMSVDTFQLHLTILLGKKIIPIGIINPFFMPPNEWICNLN